MNGARIGLAEAAQRLAVPYQTAHRLLLIGALRGNKVAGRWYVGLRDVERLVSAQRATKGPDEQPVR